MEIKSENNTRKLKISKHKFHKPGNLFVFIFIELNSDVSRNVDKQQSESRKEF